jgi:hypothetical protein
MQISCPTLPNKSFEKKLQTVYVGEDVVAPCEIMKVIPAFNQTVDSTGFNLKHAPGILQKKAIHEAILHFKYKNFLIRNIYANPAFMDSEARIYQFQNPEGFIPFVYGMFVTDGNGNLIDYCCESSKLKLRKQVLVSLITAICTKESVAKRVYHYQH